MFRGILITNGSFKDLFTINGIIIIFLEETITFNNLKNYSYDEMNGIASLRFSNI